jgi:hypothetical protein
MIDRYVYAVTKGLSQKYRDDIDKELRTLIDDMLEQYQEDEPYEKKVERVLLGLGDPKLLSDSYRDSKRYLIGPQNFENYIFILKIVLGAVFLGISIATALESFFEPQESAIGIFISYLATVLSAMMQGFAWVTAGFAIAEYKGVKLLDKNEINEGWSIADLPEIPQKEAVISKGETIFSILISTIFISVLFFAPQVLAAYINNGSGGTIIIPLFNIEVLNQLKVLMAAMLILEIIKEGLKLYYGRWTMKLSIPLTVLSIALGIISLWIFANPNVWNTNFPLEVTKYLNIDVAAISPWSSFSTGIVIIIILATIIDVATTLYKGIKYNK